MLVKIKTGLYSFAMFHKIYNIASTFSNKKKYIKFIYIDMKRFKIGIWYTNL